MSKMVYVAPEARVLGSVQELTKQFNKISTSRDAASQVIPSIVGTLNNL